MNWTVGKKIGAGFALALAILTIISAISYSNTAKIIHTMDERRHGYEVLRHIEVVLSLLKDAETGQRGFTITGEEPYLEPYNDAIGKIQPEIEQLRFLTSEYPSQQERLAMLKTKADEKLRLLEQTITLRREQGFDNALQFVKSDQGKKAMDEIRKIAAEMTMAENDLLTRRKELADSAAAGTKSSIVVGTVLAVIFLSVAGFLIVRSIAIPLQEITGAAGRIAAGDLAVNFSVRERDDEVGRLTQTFRRMVQSLQGMAGVAKQMAAGDLSAKFQPQSDQDVLGNALVTMAENLRGLIKEMLEGVNVLAASGGEIMASTSQLAAGAAETAAAVSETTTTVEEVKQTSQVSSQKGRTVSESSQKAAAVTESGRKAVEETIAGMNRIREQMEFIADSIVKLSEQTQAIGEIIATVDDLAAQSNLLAVNASIEAAKAGEHGKGFGVVAQEVKSLAEQSRQATTQVRGILSDIQKATSSAVLATEQGSKAVEAGVQQSTAAGQSINLLADNIADAAQAATQIAATSQQQFVGMDQVAMAMENIRQASTQTVASTRQAEAAAQSLHDLGLKLKDLAARFKV